MKIDINYGPLTSLLGTWSGASGMDVAPEPDGPDQNPYYEILAYTPVGDVENAESQTLATVHYRQIVRRKSNDEVFHDESGYWMWDEDAGLIMHSLTIPRGVCLLAGGKDQHSDSSADTTILEVAASLDDSNWKIIQSPFMRENASTQSFHHKITVKGNQMHYAETTVVNIYDKAFEHTDENTLIKQD